MVLALRLIADMGFHNLRIMASRMDELDDETAESIDKLSTDTNEIIDKLADIAEQNTSRTGSECECDKCFSGEKGK